MDPSEDAPAEAERHIREAEKRVACQVVINEEMARVNHPHAAAMGREVLTTRQRSFELAHYHLRAERKVRGVAA